MVSICSDTFRKLSIFNLLVLEFNRRLEEKFKKPLPKILFDVLSLLQQKVIFGRESSGEKDDRELVNYYKD